MASRIKLLALALSLILLFSDRLGAIKKRGYYPEDWISYTKTRFIRTISVGFYNVYFGTTGGILVYDMNKKQWLAPITTSDGLPDQNIQRIAASPDDAQIWVSTPTGVYKYESAFEEWSFADLFPLEYYQEDFDSVRNFQTYIPPFGFHIIPPNLIQDSRLNEYPIVSAVESKWGDLWLGTWGYGMAEVENYTLDLEFHHFGLYSDDCHAIARRSEIFYFGGKNDLDAEHALTVWDRANNEWKYLESRYSERFSSDQINDIAAIDNLVFLATDFGLVKLNQASGNFTSYTAPEYLTTDQILSLCYDKGLLYFGSDRGLYVLDIKRDSIHFMSGNLTDNMPIYDIQYYKGDVWIGSENGAIRYDFDAQKFYRYASAGGALLTPIHDIEKDTRDGLWFACKDALIWMNDRFEEQERFIVNTELKGFPANRLLVQERYLWVGTDIGVFRYDRAKHYWKQYTEEDGLIDDRVYDLLPDGDYLWIGTAGGVTRFYWNNPIRGEDY